MTPLPVGAVDQGLPLAFTHQFFQGTDVVGPGRGRVVVEQGPATTMTGSHQPGDQVPEISLDAVGLSLLQ